MTEEGERKGAATFLNETGNWVQSDGSFKRATVGESGQTLKKEIIEKVEKKKEGTKTRGTRASIERYEQQGRSAGHKRREDKGKVTNAADKGIGDKPILRARAMNEII